MSKNKKDTFWGDISDEDFRKIIAPAKSRVEGLKLLGLSNTYCNRLSFSRRAEELEIKVRAYPISTKREHQLTSEDKEWAVADYEKYLEASALHVKALKKHYHPTASSWKDLTDTQFQDILENSDTLGEAFKKMHVSHTAFNKQILVNWASFLGIDISQYPKMSLGTIPVTKMREAIENSSSYTDLAYRLGVSPNASNMAELRKTISMRALKRPEDDLYEVPFTRRWSSITKKEMEEALSKHATFRDIALYLGCTEKGVVGGSNAKVFHKRVQELGLIIPYVPGEADFNGLKGSAKRRFWLLQKRGHICEVCCGDEHNNNYIPLEMHHEDEDRTNNTVENLSLLCNNCHAQQHNRGKATSCKGVGGKKPFHLLRSIKTIRLALIREREHRCEGCYNEDWQDNYLPLELHHVDRNHKNNHPANLRLLCSNCHAIAHDKGQTWEVQQARTITDKVQARERTVERRHKKAVKKIQREKQFHPSGFFTDPNDY